MNRIAYRLEKEAAFPTTEQIKKIWDKVPVEVKEGIQSAAFSFIKNKLMSLVGIDKEQIKNQIAQASDFNSLGNAQQIFIDAYKNPQIMSYFNNVFQQLDPKLMKQVEQMKDQLVEVLTNKLMDNMVKKLGKQIIRKKVIEARNSRLKLKKEAVPAVLISLIPMVKAAAVSFIVQKALEVVWDAITNYISSDEGQKNKEAIINAINNAQNFSSLDTNTQQIIENAINPLGFDNDIENQIKEKVPALELSNDMPEFVKEIKDEAYTTLLNRMKEKPEFQQMKNQMAA